MVVVIGYAKCLENGMAAVFPALYHALLRHRSGENTPVLRFSKLPKLVNYTEFTRSFQWCRVQKSPYKAE